MSFCITFGSIGDIIAVGQIAISLVKALRSGCGSAKEYQSLVRELENFDKALLQVIALWQNYDLYPSLADLRAAAMSAIKQCQECLHSFSNNVAQTYDISLGVGSSSNWLKSTSKKILWLKEKEDIAELRNKLQLGLNLELIGASECNKLDNATQLARIGNVHRLLQDSLKLAEEQRAQVQAIEKKIALQTETSGVILRHVRSGINTLLQVKGIVAEMRGMMIGFHNWIALQNTVPGGLRVCWQQAPVTLEDAFGKVVPIPLELIDSWDMLETLLVKRFENSLGHTKVLNHEYAIEDSLTGKELAKSRKFAECFRPGGKVDMIMVFKTAAAGETSCPRCKAVVSGPGDVQIKCPDTRCGMWFRRVEEMVELEERHLDDLQIDETSENGQWKSFPAGSSKDSKNKVVEADPSDFQRVRLVSEKRPPAPSPAPKMARYSQVRIGPWKDPRASTLTLTKPYQPGSPSPKYIYRRLIVPPPAIFTHPSIIQLSDSSEDEEDEDEEDEDEEPRDSRGMLEAPEPPSAPAEPTESPPVSDGPPGDGLSRPEAAPELALVTELPTTAFKRS